MDIAVYRDEITIGLYADYIWDSIREFKVMKGKTQLAALDKNRVTRIGDNTGILIKGEAANTLIEAFGKGAALVINEGGETYRIPLTGFKAAYEQAMQGRAAK